MKNIKLAIISSAVLFALVGCNEPASKNEKPTTENAQTTTQVEAPAAQLDTLLADYFEDSLQFNPIGGTYIGRSEYNDQFIAPINKANRDEQLNFVKEYKNKLENINIFISFPGMNSRFILSYLCFFYFNKFFKDYRTKCFFDNFIFF